MPEKQMIQSNFHVEVHIFSSLVSCVFRTYQNKSKIFFMTKELKTNIYSPAQVQ